MTRMAGRSTVKDIVQNEELFSVQIHAEDTDAGRHGGVLEAVKTPLEQATRIQELEM